jgi:hypothetical protein
LVCRFLFPSLTDARRVVGLGVRGVGAGLEGQETGEGSGELAVEGYFVAEERFGARAMEDFRPWLDGVLKFPEQAIQQAIKQIPGSWLEGEEAFLSRLLDQLLIRRRRVPDLV